MAAATASSLELGLPEEDPAASPVPRSLLKDFEAVSDYPGQPDAEPLVARRRSRAPRGLGGRSFYVVVAALAAAGLLAGAGTAAAARRSEEPKSRRGDPARSLVLQGRRQRRPSQGLADLDGCGDAVVGDGCHENVEWAMEHGIFEHPEWYPGLTSSSPAGGFQRALFEMGKGGCRRPCDEAQPASPGGVSSTGSSSSKVDSHLRRSAGAAGSSKKKALEASKKRRSLPKTRSQEPRKPLPGAQEASTSSAPAAAGERRERPERGTTTTTQQEASASPAPAAAGQRRERPERSEAAEGPLEDCHDAVPGEQCYGQVQWAMQTGVVSNPEWYPGLDASSPLEDFQAFLASNGRDGCRVPCATGRRRGPPAHPAPAGPRVEAPVPSGSQGQQRKNFQEVGEIEAQIEGFGGGPTVFCWMLFKAHSYESGLVQLQLTSGYNIFACDAYALFTDFPTRLSDGTETTPLGSIESPPSAWGSVLNTEPFVKAWSIIVEDGSFREYDWTAKADADAVFFPDRLRQSLANVPKRRPYWVQNSEGNTPLIGPLEVFSKEAIELYAEKGKSCARPDVMLVAGEDGFMAMCMREIGAEPWVDLAQILWTTVAEDCRANWNVAYHPFKDVGSYMACEFATD